MVATVFHLVVNLQVRENYGAHDWDGSGSCPQWWKNKGSVEKYVMALSLNEVINMGSDGIYAYVRANIVEYNDHYSEEFITGYELIAIDSDLLVRVRAAAIVEQMSYPECSEWPNGLDISMEIAYTIGISETAAGLALERLADPCLILPMDEDRPVTKWDDYHVLEQTL